MLKLTQFAMIGLLALLSSVVMAETPDQCAARLDQSIAIRTFAEAADWWAQVERECATEPVERVTPEARKADFIGLYGDSGELAFCVTSSTLNVRDTPGTGAVIDRLAQGTLFTVDLGSKVKTHGYVWAEHDKGWSALYATTTLDHLVYPESCPAPTPRTTHSVLKLEQTRSFQLSGADCAITVESVFPDEADADTLYILVGRIGWLRDEFVVNLFAPGGGPALTFIEVAIPPDYVGDAYTEIYLPDSTNNAHGFYTIEVATYTESKRFRLQINSYLFYRIGVACE